MEKLELKHIAPYLPYKLKAIKGVTRIELTSIDLELPLIFHTSYLGSRLKVMSNIADIKPILRPLSDLTQEIEHNGERFVPTIMLGIDSGKDSIKYTPKEFNVEQGCNVKYRLKGFYTYTYLTYYQTQKLFEWHFDVFGLIDKGLAIEKE